MLVIVLVMNLSTLRLFPGSSFSLGQTDIMLPGVSEPIPGNQTDLFVLRGLVALACILLPPYILYSLMSTKGRQRLITNIIILLLLLASAYLIKSSSRSHFDAAPMNMDDYSREYPADEGDTPVFSAGKAPPLLTVLALVVALVVGVAAAGVGMQFLFQQRINRTQHPSVHALAAAAQDTIDSLRGGGDFRIAIIRCYYEMNRVVREQRGLARSATMTPREFEMYLVGRGLPQSALETLTRLFEQVRYGSVAINSGDETMAFTCLSEIVNICEIHDQE